MSRKKGSAEMMSLNFAAELILLGKERRSVDDRLSTEFYGRELPALVNCLSLAARARSSAAWRDSIQRSEIAMLSNLF